MKFIHLIYILLILSAIYSVFAKNIKRAIVGSGAFGLWISIAYMLYEAPDVAIAEAVISSSLATILFIVSIKNYNDISTKLRKLDWKQLITYLLTLISLGTVIYLTYTSVPFTDSFLGMLVMERFIESGSIVNPVSSIVLNYRGFDTVFEALLLLIASVGVVHLVNSAKSTKPVIIREDDPWHEIPDFGNSAKFYSYNEKVEKGLIEGDRKERSLTLRHKKHPSAVMIISFVFPVLIFLSIYMVSNPFGPGCGFQGGGLLAATFVSHYLIMPDNKVNTRFLNTYEKFIFIILFAILATYVLLGVQAVYPQFYWVYILVMDILLGTKVFCGLTIMFLSFAKEHNKV